MDQVLARRVIIKNTHYWYILNVYSKIFLIGLTWDAKDRVIESPSNWNCVPGIVINGDKKRLAWGLDFGSNEVDKRNGISTAYE